MIKLHSFMCKPVEYNYNLWQRIWYMPSKIKNLNWIVFESMCRVRHKERKMGWGLSDQLKY